MVLVVVLLEGIDAREIVVVVAVGSTCSIGSYDQLIYR